MEERKPCRCGGMNEECAICGGSGYLDSLKVEFHRTEPSPDKIEKEKTELDAYLRPPKIHDEKLDQIRSRPDGTSKPARKKKKEKTAKQQLKQLQKKATKLERKRKVADKKKASANPKKKLADLRILAKGKIDKLNPSSSGTIS